MSEVLQEFLALLRKHGVYQTGERDDRVIFYLRSTDLDAVRNDMSGSGAKVSKLTENVIMVEVFKKEA